MPNRFGTAPLRSDARRTTCWDGTAGATATGSQTLTAEEAEIVDCYRASAPQWQQNIAMTARAAAGESKKKAEDNLHAADGRKAANA